MTSKCYFPDVKPKAQKSAPMVKHTIEVFRNEILAAWQNTLILNSSLFLNSEIRINLQKLFELIIISELMDSEIRTTSLIYAFLQGWQADRISLRKTYNEYQQFIIVTAFPTIQRQTVKSLEFKMSKQLKLFTTISCSFHLCILEIKCLYDKSLATSQ